MKHLKRYALPLILVILMILAYVFDLHQSLSFSELQNRKEDFQSYTNEHPVISIGIFSLVYVIAVALSLPFATLLTLLGGFLFGFWLGTGIVVSSATIGATIIFLIAKTSFGAVLREKAGKLYTKIEHDMNENAIGYLFFMRLVPIFPFFLVNIAPALFNISLQTYVVTTFLGILPGSAVYVYTGQSLGDIDDPKDIFSIEVISAFVLLGIFAIIPTLYKKFKKTA